jgi:hypothetical protein
MVPICTPSIFELGFPWAKAVKKSLPPSTAAAGTLDNASFPNSRLLSIRFSSVDKDSRQLYFPSATSYSRSL